MFKATFAVQRVNENLFKLKEKFSEWKKAGGCAISAEVRSVGKDYGTGRNPRPAKS